jgi:hypothetical protein
MSLSVSDPSSVAKSIKTFGSIRTVVVAQATCLPHLPALNRVPDPASRSTQVVVEALGTFTPVDRRRKPSRNWTSRNVLPTCTRRGCTSLCVFVFQNVGPADHGAFGCVNFSLGTPLAGVALQTLPLASCRTSMALVDPTAPIILTNPTNMTPSPTVVVAEEISRVIIHVSLESGTRTTPRQGSACLVEFLKGELELVAMSTLNSMRQPLL